MLKVAPGTPAARHWGGIRCLKKPGAANHAQAARFHTGLRNRQL